MEFDSNYGSRLPPVYYVQHHRAHAANAFFLSPFEDAAILTADWRGEFESMTFAHGSGRSIKLLGSQKVPHSLGMFYATFTELLGYRPDNDEWKVMALSAFDVDCSDFIEKIRSTIHLGPNGKIELNQSYYQGALVDQPKLYTGKLKELLGGREGQPGELPNDWHFCVARALQIVSEEIALHYINHLYNITDSSSLVLSGGFFMNSVFNGKVSSMSPFKKVYISYAPGDSGNSIGAALYTAHCILGESRQRQFNPSQIGPSFSNADILSALQRRKISYRYIENIEHTIATILAQGDIIAVFNGPMEFGDRALGNRSILGDPRHPKVKDKINASIKYREAYRPFAPATLYEVADHYFDIPAGMEIPYMEKVVPVREKFRSLLPAITHVDGSGRLQTVREEHSPYFYKIISEFGELTGIPVVLNTSFNINGEPIVLAPDDALNTFFNSGLEYLALGNYMVTKT